MKGKKIKVEKLGRVPGHAGLPSLNDELVDEIKQHLETAPELVGPRGQRGVDGDVGRRGRRGLKGETGESGPDGDHGVDGKIGGDGVKGKDGAIGLTGRQGGIGPQGLKGDKGNKGDKGDQGEKGKQGRTGPGGGRGGAGRSAATTDFNSISLVGTDLVFARDKAGPLGPSITVDLSSLAGQGGFVGLGPWRSRTEIVSPPASGQLRFNNADPELATELFLHETNSNGEDLANFIALLEAGDLIYIQVANDSSKFILCEISSNTDSGVFVTLGLANVSQQGGAIAQNTTVNVIATIAGGGSGGGGGDKEVFFANFEQKGIGGSNYQGATIGASDKEKFTFHVPFDFTTLVDIVLIGFPKAAGSSGAGKNIDLNSDYGAIGEQNDNHSESDVGTTYTTGGGVEELFELDLSTVFSSLAAGDSCGVEVEQFAVGGDICYVGIRLRYS